MNPKTITWRKASFIHPNLININNRWTLSEWSEETHDIAMRVYQQAILLPNLTGKELLALVENKYDVTIDESDDENYTVSFALKEVSE